LITSPHLKIEKPKKNICTSTPGFDWGLITVGDVVVFISDHETPLVATDNLNASLEIKREVEACSSGDRYLLVEVKKASAVGAKRLDSLVPAKIELQTNW
jgi:hypothetical protein